MTGADMWRAVDDAIRVVEYLLLTVCFGRFRSRSLWPGLCTALMMVFGSAVIITALRGVALFTPSRDWLLWPEVGSSVLLAVCVFSAAQDVRSAKKLPRP